MRVTLLCTGTSTGIPMIGCTCQVCTSTDSRDMRLRTAALIETPDGNILIDAGPDMRQQLLRAGTKSLHAVLLTHEHQDHIGGIDDLRPLNYRMDTPMPVYGRRRTIEAVKKRYYYAFDNNNGGSSRPNLTMHELTPWQTLTLAGVPITVLPITHGTLDIFGYRIGNLAYITDASNIDAEVVRALAGVDTLIINALRDDPHPMHLSFDQAQAYVERIGPRRAYYVHLTHDILHATLIDRLPTHIQPGFDGLMLEVPA